MLSNAANQALDSKTKQRILHIPKKDLVLKDLKRNRWLYMFLVPGILFIFVFKYFPIIWNIIAFQDYNIADGISGIFTGKWVGFKHFKYLFFETYDFWQVFRNMALIALYRIVWGFPAPIILALLLNEVRRMWFKKLAQTIAYLPYFISWVVVAGMVQLILSPSEGAVNELIKMLGGEPVAFMQRKEWFRTILVSITIYKEIGYGTIIYLAALAGINSEQYESAVIDGAKRLQTIRYITIPGILPTMIVVLILQVGSILRGGFEQVLLLYSPVVYEVADIIPTYVYRTGIQMGRFSYSAAVGLFESVLAVSMILVTNKLAGKYGKGGLW